MGPWRWIRCWPLWFRRSRSRQTVKKSGRHQPVEGLICLMIWFTKTDAKQTFLPQCLRSKATSTTNKVNNKPSITPQIHPESSEYVSINVSQSLKSTQHQNVIRSSLAPCSLEALLIGFYFERAVGLFSSCGGFFPLVILRSRLSFCWMKFDVFSQKLL